MEERFHRFYFIFRSKLNITPILGRVFHSFTKSLDRAWWCRRELEKKRSVIVEFVSLSRPTKMHLVSTICPYISNDTVYVCITCLRCSHLFMHMWFWQNGMFRWLGISRSVCLSVYAVSAGTDPIFCQRRRKMKKKFPKKLSPMKFSTEKVFFPSVVPAYTHPVRASFL